MKYGFASKHKAWSGWVFYLLLIAGAIVHFGFDGEVFEEYLTLPVLSFLYDPLFNEGSGLFTRNNIIDEVITIGLVISGLVHGFSREAVEDELISKMRMEALAWSLFWNCGFLILGTLFIYGVYYFQVMTMEMFMILLLFNLRFSWMLRKHYKEAE